MGAKRFNLSNKTIKSSGCKGTVSILCFIHSTFSETGDSPAAIGFPGSFLSCRIFTAVFAFQYFQSKNFKTTETDSKKQEKWCLSLNKSFPLNVSH